MTDDQTDAEIVALERTFFRCEPPHTRPTDHRTILASVYGGMGNVGLPIRCLPAGIGPMRPSMARVSTFVLVRNQFLPVPPEEAHPVVPG
jgi:hypothetical protein